MKAYFNRNAPLYLLAADEMGDHEGFDAYPVDVDGTKLEQIQALREVILLMEALFQNNPAPEECAQSEAETFVGAIGAIFDE